MGRLRCPYAHRLEGVRQPVELTDEERVPVVHMRGKRIALDLFLSGDEVAKKRDADRSANVAGEIADSGNLIKLLARHSNVIQCADRDEDRGMPTTWRIR